MRNIVYARLIFDLFLPKTCKYNKLSAGNFVQSNTGYTDKYLTKGIARNRVS